MKNISILLCLTIFIFSACESDQGEEHKYIAQLERAVETTPPTVTLGELLEGYSNYEVEHPNEQVWNARYQYRMGAVHYRSGAFPDAAQVLGSAIKLYYDEEATQNSYLLLADIYQNNYQNEMLYWNVISDFVQRFPNHENVNSLKATFPKKEDYIMLMDSIESEVFNEADGEKMLNRKALPKLAMTYETYTNFYPDAEDAISTLNKAAETYRSINDPQKAIMLWDRIYKNYKDTDYAPKALFQKALCLEDDLKDLAQAEMTYKAFLEEYPNDAFAEAAKFSLDNLGKPLDEVIQGFEGK